MAKPPVQERRRAFLALVAAGVVSLPTIYFLVAGAVHPVVAMGVGLLSMGLAWAGGCSLEWRRIGTVRGLAALGAAQAALAFVPAVGAALGPLRWLLVASAAFSAVALWGVVRAAQASS